MSEEMVEQDVNVEPDKKLPEGWRRPQTISEVGDILKSYDGCIQDSVGIQAFLQNLQEGLVFVHDKCWIGFTEIAPGMKASIHGAKFGIKDEIDGEFEEILTHVAETLEVIVVYAMIPDRATDARSLMERHEFVEHGYLPCFDRYNGEIQGLRLYARFMK